MSAPCTHTHTKSISRWVSGNSSFNYSSPLSWAKALQVGRAVENREGSPWGCAGTTGDAGGEEGELNHFVPVHSQSRLRAVLIQPSLTSAQCQIPTRQTHAAIYHTGT